MSIPSFSQVIIGFGNSRGQTTTKLLSETTEKINRVNIKSQFGSNPRISIKPLPQITLSPFQQMIYKKYQYAKLKQLIYGQSKLHQSDPKKYLQQIKQSALKSYQQLAQELELIKNFGQNEDLEFLITKTNCSEQQAKKYMQKYKNKDKAMEMIVRHRVMVQDVAKKFMCNKNEAKQFLEANNYSMDLLG